MNRRSRKRENGEGKKLDKIKESKREVTED
jgi:hypothetical protein